MNISELGAALFKAIADFGFKNICSPSFPARGFLKALRPKCFRELAPLQSFLLMLYPGFDRQHLRSRKGINNIHSIMEFGDIHCMVLIQNAS
jgi:hypothetical protein